MEFKSLAFIENAIIPTKYTCDGQGMSPSLEWSDLPSGTMSLVMIMDDPDAPGGTWDHWLLFNIPSSMKGIPEDIRDFPPEIKFGLTSWGNIDYGGPCPPDKEHRYFFTLYALDTVLNIESGIAKAQLLRAMQGHILESAQLIGRYNRPRKQ